MQEIISFVTRLTGLTYPRLRKHTKELDMIPIQPMDPWYSTKGQLLSYHQDYDNSCEPLLDYCQETS